MGRLCERLGEYLSSQAARRSAVISFILIIMKMAKFKGTELKLFIIFNDLKKKKNIKDCNVASGNLAL